jgi:hypothetical protein
MGAIKKAFEKIGDGISGAVKGIAHGIEGVAKIAGGALTFNPQLLKEGAKDFDKGLKQGISGIGAIAAGAAGAAVGATPLGAAVNALTHGAASRLAEKVVGGTADMVNNGISGAKGIVDGVAHGDLGKAFDGALKVAELASVAVPGFGAGALAARSAMTVGKGFVREGAMDVVQDTATSAVR